MKKAFILFLFVLFGTCVFSQKQAAVSKKDDTHKIKRSKISIGGTYAYTLLNLNINYLKETQNDANDLRLYFSHGMYRFVINYENVRAVDLKPSWLNVQSRYYDFCLNLLDLSAQPVSMYPIFGITYEKSSAYYTGANYITELLPYKDTDYKRNYWGVTIGGGLEISITKHLKFFGELRVRIMKNDEKIGFNDMVLATGIKLDLFSFNLNHIFRKPNDKYHWF